EPVPPKDAGGARRRAQARGPR
ncbi:MAG: hypothetical protein AVDCRST_MAG05-1089, partial [uncultured Rubrobacteraceae bacterium]